ncbi:hypothetical protein UCRPC4_g06111 [Phaeomoniella chlamydospora]|uniref:Uncharacterized protein n=1 Tax=Phaeomoniella chlamydospora TaxID=158046 RepID=A0A0G2FV70_PHACM|nr:hypothetical protein UCRPC4_g06111 [Phaeomoniella chlamydospora]
MQLSFSSALKLLLTTGTILSHHTVTTAGLNITYYQNVSIVPHHPLPKSHAESDASQVLELFAHLGRTTVWNLVDTVQFEGDLWEPEGLIRLGPDRYIVSAGEYTEATVKYNATVNGTDRTAGAGFSHLVVFDGNGTRLADATLSEQGAVEYHNGGLDYDGQYIWAAIAQYRPNSTATVMRVDPNTLEPTPILHAGDHEGGIIHDPQTNTITTLNWGSRNASRWSLAQLPLYDPSTFVRPLTTIRNPSYFNDYQDCKFLGHLTPFANYPTSPLMLCSGFSSITSGDTSFSLGGIAIIDVDTMVPLFEVPITIQSELGKVMTQNPVDFSVEDGKLRFYWLPDQVNTTLYIYEAQPGMSV